VRIKQKHHDHDCDQSFISWFFNDEYKIGSGCGDGKGDSYGDGLGWDELVGEYGTGDGNDTGDGDGYGDGCGNGLKERESWHSVFYGYSGDGNGCGGDREELFSNNNKEN